MIIAQRFSVASKPYNTHNMPGNSRNLQVATTNYPKAVEKIWLPETRRNLVLDVWKNRFDIHGIYVLFSENAIPSISTNNSGRQMSAMA